MTREIKKLREHADYLRHCANVAEREYVAPAPLGDDEEQEERLEPLYVRLREAADKVIEAARFLEDAEQILEYADDLSRWALAEAKNQDWYDDAYVGFCDGMSCG